MRADTAFDRPLLPLVAALGVASNSCGCRSSSEGLSDGLADELGHGCLVMPGQAVDKELTLPIPVPADECPHRGSGRQGEKDEGHRLEVVHVSIGGKVPGSSLRVTVEKTFLVLLCAPIRARLRDSEVQIERSDFPTYQPVGHRPSDGVDCALERRFSELACMGSPGRSL